MTDHEAKPQSPASDGDSPVVAKPPEEIQSGPTGDNPKGDAPTKTQANKKSPSRAVNPSNVQKLPTQFGRYRLIRELGRGGMGAVVLAEDTQLGRQVALKIPFLKKASDTRTLKRFEREAKAAAGLSHPHLCAVYDFGTFDNHHFLSMAYIEGRPLQEYLNGGHLIPQRTAAGIVRKIASALSHAHQRGVIHRDLKPSNIMIEPNIGPVVTDFGLARCLDEDGEAQLTQDGVAIGTPSYMSPEQLDGDSSQMGPQSDIFSLGLIFYEMLTGQRRFQGKVASIIGQILTKDPTPLRDIREDIDPRLDEICQKMMARELSVRYGSMAEVANVMRAYLKGELSPTAAPAVASEAASDPEVFFAELAAFDQNQSFAPSTQAGGALIDTQGDPAPPIVISEGESRTSQILQQRAKTSRWKLLLLLGGGLIAATLGLIRLYNVGHPGKPEPAQPTKSDLATTGLSDDEQPEDLGFPVLGLPDFPKPVSTPEPTPPAWDAAENLTSGDPSSPSPRQPMPTPAEPLSSPETTPAPSNPPAPGPEPPAEPKETEKPGPVKPNQAQGKLDFQALVTKTINGSTTERKHTIPRSAVSEVAQLERRQQNEDEALESVRILILLNGNAFAFEKARNARAALAALEEAILQNLRIEDVIARLKHLDPALADPPPTHLTPEQIAAFDKQIQNIFNTVITPLIQRMNNGRGAKTQNDLDLAQLRYEQECRKIKGLPENYPIPNVRARLIPAGAINPTAYSMLTGDSQRYKDQTPRGQLIKRLAEALHQGTLVSAPDDESGE